MSDIAAWLTNLGLTRYARAFEDNDIDLEVLATLSDQELASLGVSLGHRKKIGLALAAFTNIAALNSAPRDEATLRAPALNPAPGAYTPKHLADKILKSRSALEGERKQVTVMFADIQGSLQLSAQLDAEAWHALLERYFALLTAAVHRYEGTVNQYTGDGIMALFGAPIAHEDHAQRACYAALQARDALRALAADIRLNQGIDFNTRIGLNSGEVVVGKIGDDLRMDYTAQGATVGIAQRIEQCTAPGQVGLSAQTAKLIAGAFEVKSMGTAPLKALLQPLQVYELERATLTSSRLTIAAVRGLSRFVGRQAEMNTLRAAFERVRAGHGQVIGIVGEPGLGKSRLCYEFATYCRDAGAKVFEAHCPAHGRNIPYLPILELFRAYFGVEAQESAYAARQRIAGGLALLDPSLQETLPVLFDFMGVADPSAAQPAIDPELRQRLLADAVHRVAQAQDRHGVLSATFIDDVHWIDPGSDEFVRVLASAVVGRHSLLVLNFRPEYHPRFASQAHYQQLPLVPLTEPDAESFCDTLLGNDPSIRALRPKLLAWVAGNPFFLEELILDLVEAGKLIGEPGRYRLAEAIESLPVPGSVRDVLAARIDRLSESTKRVLQVAATMGRDFEASALERVTGDGVDVALAQLTASSFVFQRSLYPSLYSFKHPLTHEVAYGMQLKHTRTARHHAVADALVVEHAASLDEHAALIAHHYESAGEQGLAAQWHSRAAQWAEVHDHISGYRHWTKVRELLTHRVGHTEHQALGAIAGARCLMLSSRLGGLPQDEYQRIFEQGLHFAQAANDPALLAQLHTAFGAGIGTSYGDFKLYHEHAVVGARYAAQTDNPELQAMTGLFETATLIVQGRIDDGIAAGQRLLEELPKDPAFGLSMTSISPRCAIGSFLGMAFVSRGEIARGFEILHEAEISACALQLAESASWPTAGQAIQYALVGDTINVDAAARRMSEYDAQIGTRISRVVTLLVEGIAAYLRNDYATAISALEEGLAKGHYAHTARSLTPLLFAYLAKAQLGAGLREMAAQHADEAITWAMRGTNLWSLQPFVVRVDVALANNNVANAKGSLEVFGDAINRTGARIFTPYLLERRAALYNLQERARDEQRTLQECETARAALGLSKVALR